MAWIHENACLKWLRDGKGPAGGQTGHVRGGEGYFDYMYLDKYGLVTIGVGNLIDASPRNALKGPKSSHLAQAEKYWLASKQAYRTWLDPGKYKNGTQAKVKDDWIRVKLATDLRLRGAGAYARVAKLRMKEPILNASISKKINWYITGVLTKAPWKRDFADFNFWPADAQVALIGLMWAVGHRGLYYGRSPYPRFCAACKAWDFLTAARESSQKAEGSAYSRKLTAKRNYHKKFMFINAAHLLHRKVALNKPANFKSFQFGMAGGAVLSAPKDANGRPWKPTAAQIAQARRP
jgi:hypothetical protein